MGIYKVHTFFLASVYVNTMKYSYAYIRTTCFSTVVILFSYKITLAGRKMNCVFVVKTCLLISKSKALARSYITRARCPRLVLVCRALINVTKKGCVCKIQRNAIKSYFTQLDCKTSKTSENGCVG